MKKNIIRVLCLLSAFVMLCGCSTPAKPEDIGFQMEFGARAEYDNYEVMAENGGYKLMLDPGRMDLMMVSDDFTWHSYVFTSKVLKATSNERDNSSIFRIEGALIGGSQFTLDSYTDCINRGQYEISKIDNGFKVHFVTGKLAVSRALPEVMEKEKFEAFLEKIAENESKRVSKKIGLSYSFYTLDTADEERLEKYPQLTKFPDGLYCIKTGLTDKEKDEFEVYFKAAGATIDEIKEYHESIEYESEETANPVVSFDMNFVLENGDLVVSLPTQSILMDNSRYLLNSIRILESLTAVNKSGETIPVDQATLTPDQLPQEETPAQGEGEGEDAAEGEGEGDTEEKTDDKKKDEDEEGETSGKTYVDVPTGESARFVFYPDGSGVVADISASNTIIGEGTLTGQVYNTTYNKLGGYAINSVYGSENINLPVFGLAKTSGAVLGIIEKGAEVSRITANYNSAIVSAFSTFEIEPYDPENVDEMVAMSEKYTAGDKRDFVYQVRYKFLKGTDIDYVDLAKTYREYLIAKGDLAKDGVSKELQFYLETLGYVKAAEDIAFITVQKDKPLTTYEDNIDLLKRLAKGGVKNLNLRLNGWENGGLSNYYTDGVELSKAMGGKEGFEKLTKYVTDNKINFFPNVNFMSVGNIKMFDGFDARSMAARDILNQYEGLYVYIPANKEWAGFSYILNGKNILTGMNQYLADAKDYWNTAGISTDYISTVLTKDYHAEKEISTSEQLKEIKNAMQTLSKDRKVMFNGANDYAFKYADVILGTSTSSTENPSLQTVPFLQIVLHGSVDFAGAAINTFDTYEDAVLKTIEYASGVYFTMIKDNLMYLKGSEYSYYYSTDDDYWVGKATEAYKTVNEAIGDCYSSEISDHRRLATNVYQTTFSNGKSVVVNYNLYDVTLSNGDTVKSKGYVKYTDAVADLTVATDDATQAPVTPDAAPPAEDEAPVDQTTEEEGN